MESITTNQQNLTNHVQFLTELNPARNYQNIESLAKASEYIEQHFVSLGLDTRRQVWTVYGQEYSNVVARSAYFTQTDHPFHRELTTPCLAWLWWFNRGC